MMRANATAVPWFDCLWPLRQAARAGEFGERATEFLSVPGA
jgi:hypothetical protein